MESSTVHTVPPQVQKVIDNLFNSISTGKKLIEEIVAKKRILLMKLIDLKNLSRLMMDLI